MRLEHAIGQGIELHLDCLARRDLALVTLGQAEVDIEDADVLQVDQVSAVFDIVPDVDAADAHQTRKWRHDAHSVQSRTRQRQLRLRHLQAGCALVQHSLGHEILRHQFLVTLVVGLCNGDLGQRLLDFGAL